MSQGATPVDAAEPTLPLELLRLTRQCRAIDKYVSASAGLPIDEMHSLCALHSDHPASVTRLSELVNVSPTRASKILKSLEQRGLVTRAFDPADHRRERVVLTEKGENTIAGIISLVTEVGSELLGSGHRMLPADLFRLSQGVGKST